MNNNFISLYDLTSRIKNVINSEFLESVWIIAEISELNINKSGHCYLNLIEKNKLNDSIIAQSRATIWSSKYRMLKPFFESTTGIEFTSGINILIKVEVTFHEQYGFSLNIRDIDPSYTIGDIELKRKITIDKLINDGVFNLNKEIDLPLVPKNIAIISSKTAAGYGDFINQIESNSYGFKFNKFLFDSIMQGDSAVESIISSLDKIYEYEDLFDLVVIIRGGGAKADLSCFDNYNLAYNIAQFPLPVISGIGHERDESIVDLVSNISLKTPTAVAEFLISKFEDLYSEIEDLKDTFSDLVSEKVRENKQVLYKYSNNFVKYSNEYLSNNKLILSKNINRYNTVFNSYFKKQQDFIKSKYDELKNYAIKEINSQKTSNSLKINRLKQVVGLQISDNKNKLNIFEIKNIEKNPINVLSKGYSLTYLNGELIKSKKQAKKGNKIITKFFDGELKSEVK